MLPGFKSFKIYRGDTFAFQMTLKTGATTFLNITNSTFIAQIKEKGKTAVAATLVITKENLLGGVIKVTLSSSESAKLVANKSYVYDVQMTNGTNDTTILTGPILVTADVSSAS
jgi:hypothetical protein